ncbi:DUF6428 family protein [Mesonia sp. K4-1]|uniref:DUF6428 family protein n=1 Tax=Mesonia sp. K4-1 TaxID=2602760 RepID=UPI0011C73432|nr:DUF6428 family protein [Mesonia sp. K4-1]TXK76195.1 hypothetical protein FT986_07140 [Mesonia sp. K4-1]
MNLEEFKNQLSALEKIYFQLPSGALVPSHFHVTEVAKVEKEFVDCGGEFRKEEKISLQLWEADDYDHRLHPEKLIAILKTAESTLSLKNVDIEVEYQGNTIETYDLNFSKGEFLLVSKKTDCLAKDQCGIPEKKLKVELSGMSNNTCTPNSGCC